MSYPSDFTDEQWAFVEPLFLKLIGKKGNGRPREWSYRQILDGIGYVNRTGCQWRNVPNDLPPWQTLATYLHKWSKSGIIESLYQQTRELKLSHSSSVLAVDSQSVKAINMVLKKTRALTDSNVYQAGRGSSWLITEACS